MNTLPSSIFFIGIAGIGVSALAQLAQARGVSVSGSDPGADPAINPAIARLLDGGATVYRTHDAANITDEIALVVATAAVKGDNPEIIEANRRGIRIVSRAEFLGELMAAHHGAKIAVGGTHGKTTTTAMLGVMFQEAGWNPTVFVGAEVAQLGGNVRVGDDNAPFIAEACEAYDSFLYLKPDIAIVTNIEADHLDHYGDFEGVKRSFRTFLGGVTFGDRSGIVYCAEDPPARKLVEELPSPVWRYDYGFEGETLSARMENLTFENGATRFEYVYSDALRVPVTLPFAGRHYVLNAAAALTAAVILGANDTETLAKMAQGLSRFRGAERRQELLGETEGVRILDDYAHHPTEIRATIDAVRTAYPNRRLIAVFQPHLYSRTRDFLNEFAAELSRADQLVVTDIYAAREKPIEGVTAEQIVFLAQSKNPSLTAQFVQNRQEIPALLNKTLESGDIVLVMGAGDIREQGEQLAMMRKEVKKLHIAVLMGGNSSERPVSLSTGRMILEALDKTRYTVTAMDTAELITAAGLSRFLAERPDVVFIALHGKGGEDGSLQGMLELMGIPYTGSGILSSALAMDKVMSKRLFRSAGLPVVEDVIVPRGLSLEGLPGFLVHHLGGYPVFVKPNAEGSTFGCTLVKSEEELESAVHTALKYDSLAIIEKYIEGMEITAGILGNMEEELIRLPLIEIIPKSKFYDYESKYAGGGSEHIIPARLPENLTLRAQEYAQQCHLLLGCRGMSRTDFMVKDGELFILETNTIPGMTPTSLLPQAAAEAGISFPQLLDRLIRSALK